MRRACSETGFHRPQQRRLLVQRLARQETKAEGMQSVAVAAFAMMKTGLVRIPSGVAAGLERGPQAAGGKAAGVGLALDELPTQRTR